MSIFSILVWIVIIFSIVNNIKKKQSGQKPSAKPNEPRRDVSAYQAPVQQPQRQQPQRQQPQRQAAKQSAGSSVRTAATGQAKQVPSGQTLQREKSTTELLREKAMQDEMEHRREKQQQERENELHHGHIRYAERLVEGDPVPGGKRRIVCAYCNADNLVPAHDFSTKYNCYFCREKL